MCRLRFLLLAFITFLIVVSCASQSGSASPEQQLLLSIQLEQVEVSSFDEFYGDLVLKNIGDEDLLVNGRLASVPFPWPAKIIEGVTYIADPLGDIVYPRSKIDIQFPDADMFVVLEPGQEIKRFITLSRLGYNPKMFASGEKYTLVATYQNELDVQIEKDGKIIRSWIGSIQTIPLILEFAP